MVIEFYNFLRQIFKIIYLMFISNEFIGCIIQFNFFSDKENVRYVIRVIVNGNFLLMNEVGDMGKEKLYCINLNFKEY